MAVNVEKRVENLEDVLAQFISSTNILLVRMEADTSRLKEEMRDFKAEMRDFKDEMKLFKDEMLEFKDEMKLFKDEMLEFKDEMKLFKDRVEEFIVGVDRFKEEMQEFRKRGERDREEYRQMLRDYNQRLGEIANKTGKMVEDLIYPSLPRIIREQFDLETDSLMIRIKRRIRRDLRKEFDAIALADNRVFLNSTKSDLDARDVNRFIKKDIPAFRTYFPEYNDRKLIGILASLHVDRSLIRNAEKNGLLVLATGDELMEVKNTPGFVPREW